MKKEIKQVGRFCLISLVYFQTSIADNIYEEIKSLKNEIAEQTKRLELLQERLKTLEQLVQEEHPPNYPQTIKDEDRENMIDKESSAEAPLEQAIGESQRSYILSNNQPVSRRISAISQYFNPEICVVADAFGLYTTAQDSRFDSGLYFRDAEIGLYAAIDPYAYGTVYFGVHQHSEGEWEAHVCEGFAAITSLPYGLKLRVGRFRPSFGRINPIHQHALPWLDYPYVLQEFLGHEGLVGNGGAIDWLISNPWNQYMEFSYEVMMNPGQNFLGMKTDSILQVLSFQNFLDLSSSSSILPKLAYAVDAEHNRHILGLGFTYRWLPPRIMHYRNIWIQSEAYIGRGKFEDAWDTRWGAYWAIEYQFSRRWKIGARYDFTQMMGSPSYKLNAYSFFLTFVQSEFMFWRLGYEFIDRNFSVGKDKDEHTVSIQCQFNIGAHPTHGY